jgi:hypothetical protein
MMILPMIVLLIVLEMFKTQDKTPDAGTNNPDAVFRFIQAFEGVKDIGNSTPDGSKKCNKNGVLGYVVFHCTLSVQVE